MVVEEDRKNWDLLPYVLFANRETPQASTAFTPFKLLFGRRPQGLLDIAWDAWEAQPLPFWMVVEYVKEMQGRINKVTPIIKQHMQKAQAAQCQVYN